MVPIMGGYCEGPNRELDWPIVGDEFNDLTTQQLDEADTLLLGRVTRPAA
jgi:hypothetical protein